MTVWSSAAFATLVPRPRITVSEWADAHRVIARGTASEPGPWRTARAPYLREPMNAVSDPAVERVVIQAGSQLGKSEFLLNVIGYFADQDPSPILFVQPTEIAAASFSKERIEPTFRESPRLRGKLAEGPRDKDNSILLKQFPGGYLACGWATSSVSLASRPIRVLLADEIDRYPDSTGRDGDPLAQAKQRTANFHNRKELYVSTPTILETSPIVRLYADTDQRRLWLPCLRCGGFQVLKWEGVIYKNAAGDVDLDDVHYRCEHCEGRIEERDRPEMLAAAEWRPDNPGHRHRGYQLSGLCSPWAHWRELAEEWVKAKANRDQKGLQGFINLRLGEPWSESLGDTVNAEQLEANRSDYAAEVPAEAVVLTAGVDTQDNRLEVEIVGWGIGRQSWGIEYHVIPGDPDLPETWEALDAFLARGWTRADGTRLIPLRVCVDTGGHRTMAVYKYAKRHEASGRIYAIKGRPGANLAMLGKPTVTNRLAVTLFPVGVDGAKDVLFARLGMKEPGPGYCHFPRDPSTGYDTEYFKGLCSERKKAKTRAGRTVLEWIQTYKRNEPLDCRVYAMAALEIAAIDLVAEARKQQAKSKPAPSPTNGRRVFSRGVEG